MAYEYRVNTDDFFKNNKRKDLRLYLKEEGFDVNARTTEDGMTMLHRAATYGRSKMAQDLLNAGADPEAQNEDEYTPLHLAAQYGDNKTADRLLDSGADTGTQNKFGQTPLHLASNRKTAQALVDAGADIEQKDNFGRTPLHNAAETGSPKLVGFLLEKGAEVGARNKDGETPYDLSETNDKLNDTDVQKRLEAAKKPEE